MTHLARPRRGSISSHTGEIAWGRLVLGRTGATPIMARGGVHRKERARSGPLDRLKPCSRFLFEHAPRPILARSRYQSPSKREMTGRSRRIKWREEEAEGVASGVAMTVI